MELNKALVTGGAGFIASHLVDSLLSQGKTVIVYDNFCTGREEFLPKQHQNLKVICGDVLDLPTLTGAMAGGWGCSRNVHDLLGAAVAEVRGEGYSRNVSLSYRLEFQDQREGGAR